MSLKITVRIDEDLLWKSATCQAPRCDTDDECSGGNTCVYNRCVKCQKGAEYPSNCPRCMMDQIILSDYIGNIQVHMFGRWPIWGYSIASLDKEGHGIQQHEAILRDGFEATLDKVPLGRKHWFGANFFPRLAPKPQLADNTFAGEGLDELLSAGVCAGATNTSDFSDAEFKRYYSEFSPRSRCITHRPGRGVAFLDLTDERSYSSGSLEPIVIWLNKELE